MDPRLVFGGKKVAPLPPLGKEQRHGYYSPCFRNLRSFSSMRYLGRSTEVRNLGLNIQRTTNNKANALTPVTIRLIIFLPLSNQKPFVRAPREVLAVSRNNHGYSLQEVLDRSLKAAHSKLA